MVHYDGNEKVIISFSMYNKDKLENFSCSIEVLNQFLIHLIAEKLLSHKAELIGIEAAGLIALNRFLAAGDSYSTTGYSYRVGFSTVGMIVQEECQAICRRMENSYLPEPSTEIWKESAKNAEELWNLPNDIDHLKQINNDTQFTMYSVQMVNDNIPVRLDKRPNLQEE
nr:unnamed protein product [Callosobruchus analis]